MNKHIELVKKWLANPESVTSQELKDNRIAAYAAAYADDSYLAYAADAAAFAAHAYASVSFAAYWVKRYEELKEQE